MVVWGHKVHAATLETLAIQVQPALLDAMGPKGLVDILALVEILAQLAEQVKLAKLDTLVMSEQRVWKVPLAELAQQALAV